MYTCIHVHFNAFSCGSCPVFRILEIGMSDISCRCRYLTSCPSLTSHVFRLNSKNPCLGIGQMSFLLSLNCLQGIVFCVAVNLSYFFYIVFVFVLVGSNRSVIVYSNSITCLLLSYLLAHILCIRTIQETFSNFILMGATSSIS